MILGLSAYLIWGLLPMYWKLLDTTRADVVLAHRIIWSFLFMLIFLIATKKSKQFITECKRLWKHKQALCYLIIASIIISVNWLIFIWAVQHGHVIQASLGYYINPLVSILLGVIFLKEKLSPAQIFSVLLASIGVLYLTFSYGVFPWISLVLAVSFAIYGLLKKVVHMDAAFSLTLETLFITPIALFYLLIVFGYQLGFNISSVETNVLLILSGIATAVPLLLFGAAVLYLPLSTAGILQYIAPTIMLVIGVFLYDETFTRAHLFTFTLIWVSLFLFMSSSIKQNRTKSKMSKKPA